MFDLKIGELLRQAEAPVPAGAWDAIRAQIAPPASPPSLGFGAAAMGAAILLGSLVAYSSMMHDADAALAPRTLSTSSAVEPMKAETPTELGVQAENNVATWSSVSEQVPATDQMAPNPKHSAAASSILDELNADDQYNLEDQNRAKALSANELVITPKMAPQLPETLPPALSVQSFVNSDQVNTPSADVNAAESLTASIKATNLSGYAPFEIDFRAMGNFDQVDWDFGPFGKSQQAHVTRTFDKPGYYTVMLTAYSANQREMVTDMVTIEIHEGSNLVVPDSFTPNGDGINDSFKAEGVNIESFAMMVVNASGKVVFETNNINEAWVYSGGRLTSMEAYFAVIKARGVDGKNYSIKQRINIIP